MLERLFRVSGQDENDDVRAFYTNDRQRAEEMRARMEQDLERVELIGGYVVNVGYSAGQQWEYHGTAEEAFERARDLEQRGGKGVFVENCAGRTLPFRT